MFLIGILQGVSKKNTTPIFFYISIRITATVLCFIWAEIGGPPVRFAYRNMSERFAVHDIYEKPF